MEGCVGEMQGWEALGEAAGGAPVRWKREVRRRRCVCEGRCEKSGVCDVGCVPVNGARNCVCGAAEVVGGVLVCPGQDAAVVECGGGLGGGG